MRYQSRQTPRSKDNYETQSDVVGTDTTPTGHVAESGKSNNKKKAQQQCQQAKQKQSCRSQVHQQDIREVDGIIALLQELLDTAFCELVETLRELLQLDLDTRTKED